MKAKLINNLTGYEVSVIATTYHPASSYNNPVWVDEEGIAYIQVGHEQPFYSVVYD